MDRLQSMRAFCKVAQLGNFTKAANELLLSATIVSRLIADLENHLRIRLFNRTTRSVHLTEAGEDYWHYCQHILALIDEAESVAGGQEGHAHGRLRMLIGFTEGMQLLAPCLADFQAEYPEVAIDIQLAERVVDIVAEGYDLAIQPEPFLFSGSVVARPLMQARLILCAAPGYLERHGHPDSPGALQQHRCISFSHAELRDHWPLASPSEDIQIKPNNMLTSNNIEAILGTIRGGGGIGFAFEWLVKQELEDGRLIRVLPEYSGQTLNYYVVYPSRKYLPTKVQAMLKYLYRVFDKAA